MSRSPRRMPTSSKFSERADTRGASGPVTDSAGPVVMALVRLRHHDRRRQQRDNNSRHRAEDAET